MLTDRYVRIIRSQSNSEKWSNDALIVVFFKARTPTKIYTLSLHDALPIFQAGASVSRYGRRKSPYTMGLLTATSAKVIVRDRKSTRLNSSHVEISYAVFCLKKKTRFGARVAVAVSDHDDRAAPSTSENELV